MGFLRPLSRDQSGQTVVTLLVFIATAMTLTTALVAVVITTILSTTRYQTGESALAVAESGADNAIMRLTRDATYTGETLALPNGTATITVTGTTTKTITSEGVVGSFRRRVQAVISVGTNNIISVTSWSQID